MKFSGVITNDQSKVHAKGQRSKVKVTEVTTQLNRFQTVTPVWIHIWWWNDAYSLMLLRRGALLFLAATKQLYKWYFPSVCLSHLFTPQPLRAPGYCRTPSGRAGGRTGGRAGGRAAGQTSPVNTLTSIIFHGSFSNLARTFIALRSRTSSIMEVLPH